MQYAQLELQIISFVLFLFLYFVAYFKKKKTLLCCFGTFYHDVPRFPTSGSRQLRFDRRGDRTRRHLSALMNIQLQLHLPRINFGFWQKGKTQSESDGGESVDSPAAAVTVSQPQERFNILGCGWIALV